MIGNIVHYDKSYFLQYYQFNSNQYLADYLNFKIDKEYISNSDLFDSISKYIVYKQCSNDNIKRLKNCCISKYMGNYPITRKIINQYNYSETDGNLLGKKICIDYVESEGDKELYIETNKITGEPEKSQYKKFDEIEILKRMEYEYDDGYSNYYGYKYTYDIINVGLDINGNQIDVSEAEKVDYINKIGADLYVRKVIYDGNSQGRDMLVAYYTDNNRSVAKSYLHFIEHFDYGEPIKFENEVVVEKSNVPTIASAVGYRITKNGKYVVNYYSSFGDNNGLGNIYEAINSSSAKSLIQSNNEKNKSIVQSVEDEIANAKLVDDTEEYTIPQVEETASKSLVEGEEVNTGFNFSLNQTETIIVCVIGSAIMINIIAIIVGRKKRLKGDKNGR